MMQATSACDQDRIMQIALVGRPQKSSRDKATHQDQWCNHCLVLGLGDLEQVCLLHDAEELFLVHFTISIPVGFVDHFLQLFISHT